MFSKRWGYSNKGLTKEQRQKQADETLWPLFERLKEEILQKDIFAPVALYGYFPCRSDGDTLLVFDESEGFFNLNEQNKEPLESVRDRAKYRFKFPRQSRKPYRCLSDYFKSDVHDVVAFTLASAGGKFSEYESKLYKEGRYKEYHFVHGLGVDLAEALAEILHKQIRLELNIADNEGHSLRDVKMRAYKGARYSFGYDACPDLSMNKELFEMLNPEEFGVSLSESFQMHPEQSTSALVVYHPSANYFSI